jgi:uncharacterized protein (DUF58 family)
MKVAALQPPPGRQGPGVIPQPMVDAIDPLLVRLVSRSRAGDRRAAGVGTGTELAQLRTYELGDDVRHIDPAATARTGHTHVRLHVPERTLTTWIVLDLSPSMAFGTARRLKADVAEGVVRVLGQLAIRRAGSVAAVAFGAGAPHVLPPRGARPGVAALRDLLDQGVALDGRQDPAALADALRRVRALARRPGLVVVVSDFRDQHGWTHPLAAVAARHSVLAVEVSDPRETALPAVGRLALIDPESGERVDVDTSSARLRARFAELERERRGEVIRTLRRLRLRHVSLDTDGDWLTQLGRELR